MPVDTSAARNQFLATIATITQQGGISGPDAMEKIAAETAEEIAKGAPGIDSAALLAALPDVWRHDPTSHTSKSQMNAFLTVAGPVLGVDLGIVTPLATRGVARGQDVDAAIAVNKARQAAQHPSPVLQRPIDLATATPHEVRDALAEAFQDPGFIEMIGGRRATPMLREASEELSTALHYSRPAPSDEPSVMAGGVVVAGPEIRKQHQERPFGTFRAVSAQTTVGALALATAQVAAIRAGLDEIELRSAMAGKQVNLMSGHGPDPGSMPLHVIPLDDGKIGIGIGLDVQKLRAFHDNPSAQDAGVVASVGAALRSEADELAKFLDAGLPLGFFLDARVQKTETVRTALQDD